MPQQRARGPVMAKNAPTGAVTATSDTSDGSSSSDSSHSSDSSSSSSSKGEEPIKTTGQAVNSRKGRQNAQMTSEAKDQAHGQSFDISSISASAASSSSSSSSSSSESGLTSTSSQSDTSTAVKAPQAPAISQLSIANVKCKPKVHADATRAQKEKPPTIATPKSAPAPVPGANVGASSTGKGKRKRVDWEDDPQSLAPTPAQKGNARPVQPQLTQVESPTGKSRRKRQKRNVNVEGDAAPPSTSLAQERQHALHQCKRGRERRELDLPILVHSASRRHLHLRAPSCSATSSLPACDGTFLADESCLREAVHGGIVNFFVDTSTVFSRPTEDLTDLAGISAILCYKMGLPPGAELRLAYKNLDSVLIHIEDSGDLLAFKRKARGQDEVNLFVQPPAGWKWGGPSAISLPRISHPVAGAGPHTPQGGHMPLVSTPLVFQPARTAVDNARAVGVAGSRTRCGRMNGSASARKQSGTGHEGGTDSREEEAEVTHASPKKPRRKRKAKNQEERSGAADDATSKVVGEETVISSLAITLLNENDAGGPASPSANPQPVTVARRSDKPLEAFGTMEQESNAVVVPETQETPALAANVERAKEARGTAYGDMGVDEDVTTKESPSTVDLASSTRSSNDAGGAEDHDAHVTEARGGKASQAMNASQPEARPESEPEAGGQVAQCDDDQMLDASQTVSKVNADNAAVRQEEETLEPSSVMKARSARMRGKATAAVAVATVPQPFHVPGQCGICNKELSHSFESCEVIRAGRDAVQRRCQELKEKGRRKKVPERAAQKVLEQWLKSNIKNPQTQESTLDNTQMQETAVTAPKSIPTQKVSGTTQPQKDMTSLLDELGALRERASMAIKKGADLASKVQEGHHNGTPVSLYETTQAEVALRDAVQVKDSVNAPLEANPDLHTQERGVASPALSDRIKAAQIVLATTPDSQSATAAPLPAEASMRVSIADPKLAPLPGLRSPTGSDSSRELQTSPLLAPASAPPAEDEVETQAIDEPASPRKSSLAVPIGKGFEPEDSQADQIESDSSSQTSEDSDEEEEGIETDHEDVEEEEETEPEDAEAEDDILNADQGTDKQQLPNGHAQDGEGFSDSEIEEGDAEDMAEGLRSRSASPPPNQLGNHRNNEADGVAEGKEKESLRPAAVPEISQPFNPFRRSTRNGTSASQPTLAQRIIQTPFKRLSDLRPQHLRQSFSQPNSPVSAASTSTRIFPTGPATNAHDGVNGAATTPAKGGMDTANIPSTSGAESEAGEDSSESSSDSDSDSDSDEDVRKKKGKANASLCIPVSRLAGSSQNGKAKRRRSTFFKAFEG